MFHPRRKALADHYAYDLYGVYALFCGVIPAIALSILGLSVMRERASRPPQTSVPSLIGSHLESAETKVRGSNLNFRTAQATKENARNLMPAKKCSKRALPTYSKDLCLMIRSWIGSQMLCIRVTQTRNDLDVMRLLAYKTNKARSRTDLISSTMIDLMDLSSLISLNVRQENGDKLRSV